MWTNHLIYDLFLLALHSTLVAADGTLLTPDLEPVPEGFHLSSDDGRLLRPSGKPIPMGVHVGPASKLLTPDGDELPEVRVF